MSVERRGPAVCNGSNKTGGKGEMTKAPISLQDLRRSLYVKAKAEPLWRFPTDRQLGLLGSACRSIQRKSW
jgi:hypothetical protein